MHENNTAIDAIIRNTTKPRCICVAFCLFLLIVAAEVRFLFAFCCRSLSIKACSFACCFSLRLSFCCLCCSIFCCFFSFLYTMFFYLEINAFSRRCVPFWLSHFASAVIFIFISIFTYIWIGDSALRFYMSYRISICIIFALLSSCSCRYLTPSFACFFSGHGYSYCYSVSTNISYRQYAEIFYFCAFFTKKKEAKFFRFFLIYF